MAETARTLGLSPLILGDALEGEAREMATVMAGIARSVRAHGQPLAPPAVLLSGGETTVTLGDRSSRSRRPQHRLPARLLRSHWTARPTSGRSPATPTGSTAWTTSPARCSPPTRWPAHARPGSIHARCSAAHDSHTLFDSDRRRDPYRPYADQCQRCPRHPDRLREARWPPARSCAVAVAPRSSPRSAPPVRRRRC